jgi:hypothetical protein
MSHDDHGANDATMKPPDCGGGSCPRAGSSPSRARMHARWTALSLAAAVLLGGSRVLADDGVFVHIESPVPAQITEYSHQRGRLGRQALGLPETYAVCTSPCDSRIYLFEKQQYVITGQFPESPPFRPSDLTDNVTITVHPGSKRRFWEGYATLLGAIVVFPAPSVLLYLGGTDSKNAAMTGAGIGFMVVGSATATIGAVLLATSGTRIKFQKIGVGSVGSAAKVVPRYWMGEF